MCVREREREREGGGKNNIELETTYYNQQVHIFKRRVDRNHEI